MSGMWVIGGGGQIGSALVRLLGDETQAPAVRQLDLSQPAQIRGLLDRLAERSGPPRALINAAGYTFVDRAELEEALAEAINGVAPGEMARWCQRQDIPFVHYSTDYVYPGDGTRPWREDDATAPLGAYGRSKLKGDRLVEASGARYLILRTSWVYDAHGRNFVNTMLSLGRSRVTIRVVADQIGAPSYAPHVARLTCDALHQAMGMTAFPSGTYHCTPAGDVSWHQFAEEIFSGARRIGLDLKVQHVDPISTDEYPTPARRPLNSRLDKTKLLTTFNVQLPHWREGLNECLEEVVLRPEGVRPLT